MSGAMDDGLDSSVMWWSWYTARRPCRPQSSAAAANDRAAASSSAGTLPTLP